MDYTTLTRVKLALGATETSDDTLLGQCITAASRAIDRHCAGMVTSDDYFKSETISDETGKGLAASNGTILYHCRKPRVTSISAMAYRLTPISDWLALDTQYVVVENAYQVRAYRPGAWMGPVYVKISYAGGLATTTETLPADVLDAATVLAVRFYKEIKSGLTDTIGVAELGTLQYTRAIPARVVEMLKPYKRIV